MSMAFLASLPLKHPLLLALLASLALGCDDDDSSGPGLGGAAGSSTDGGLGGSGGAAGGSGGSGGDGGGAATGIVPDPLKDCGSAANPAVPELVLTEVASGLQRPIFVTQPVGDSRLFVVEKPGRIRIVSD